MTDKYSDSDVLRLAAQTEEKSGHPLGKAIAAAYSGKRSEKADNFRVTAGQGVSAVVDKTSVLCGKEDFMRSEGIDLSKSAEAVRPELESGATIVYCRGP